MNIVGISGSPSSRSRSAWLLQLAQARLEAPGATIQPLSLRDLPAQALVLADTSQPPLCEAIDSLASANLVIISTPIYKAAYSGLLKLFLDLLPTDALRGRSVLPLATGGTLSHLLAIDYALKPVLSALGARDILDPVFAVDTQLPTGPAGGYLPDDALIARLDRALGPLAPRVTASPLDHAGLAEPARC